MTTTPNTAAAPAHTPGPWVTGNTEPLLFGRKQGNGTEPLGFVYGPSFPERSEVGRRALADARLIAAAPELLAFAQEFLADYQSEDGMAPMKRYAGKAASAIAKAQGGVA